MNDSTVEKIVEKLYGDKPTENDLLTARVAELKLQVECYRAALEDVTRCEGAFSNNPLKHAENVIDNTAKVARTALKEEVK